jgi:hypothetical protein
MKMKMKMIWATLCLVLIACPVMGLEFLVEDEIKPVLDILRMPGADVIPPYTVSSSWDGSPMGSMRGGEYPVPQSRASSYPHWMSGKGISYFSNGITTWWSYWQLSNKSVATTAHSVWHPIWGFPYKVHLIPAWNGDHWNENTPLPGPGSNLNLPPFGFSIGAEIWVDSDYMKDTNDFWMFDLAAINCTVSMGVVAGSFGWQANNGCGDVESRIWLNDSYPKGYGDCAYIDGGSMWTKEFTTDFCVSEPFPPPDVGQLQYNGYEEGAGCLETCYPGSSGSGNRFFYGSSGGIPIWYIDSTEVARDPNNGDCISIRMDEDSSMEIIDFVMNYKQRPFDMENWLIRDTEFPYILMVSPDDPANHREVTVKKGQSFQYVHLWTNPTTSSAGSRQWDSSVYLSSDDRLSSGDKFLASYYAVTGIGSQESYWVWTNTIIPLDTPTGKWYLLVQQDTSDFDSSNNTAEGFDALVVNVVANPSNPPISQVYQGDVAPPGGDGQLDMSDVYQEMDYALGKDDPSPYMARADLRGGRIGWCVDCDGVVNAGDVLAAISRVYGNDSCTDE